MKDKLCTAPCLAYPEYTKEFNLEVVCLEDMSLSKKGHIPLVKNSLNPCGSDRGTHILADVMRHLWGFARHKGQLYNKLLGKWNEPIEQKL